MKARKRRQKQQVNLADVLRSLCAPPISDAPSDWCTRNIVFSESGYHGPFSVAGTEYIVEPLNLFADRRVNDIVLCWGSQTRKTGTLMGGVAYTLATSPCGLLWVMPSMQLARRFSRQRWMPMLRASNSTHDLLPTGAQRFDFSTSEQILKNGAVLNFVGSNSPGNLSSQPCRIVILDEVDKFDEGSKSEADAVNLAEQRTKDQPDPQRWKTSTPTIVEGLIWQAFLKGDCRRYFVPCPHCGKHVVLAWSKQYTVFDLLGCEAFIEWDATAARDDGTWDLDRVAASARAVCPHCGGHILSAHKRAMNANGEWRPTKSASSAFRSYHLPSLYSPSPECDFGRLAVKFLEMKASSRGMRGFINGDLAEPDVLQEQVSVAQARIADAATATPNDAVKLLTVDCQGRSPHFWYVVRAWSKEKNASCAIECGGCETIEEIEKICERHEINPEAVMLDSGWGARDDAQIYRVCAEHSSTLIERRGLRPVCSGWIPAKGVAGRKTWRDDGVQQPFTLTEIDPFLGTDDAGQVSLQLFLFAADTAKDMLESMRSGAGNHDWRISPSVAQDANYARHMASETKVVVSAHGRITHRWQKRMKSAPNHLWDCEVMQVAFAMSIGLLK